MTISVRTLLRGSCASALCLTTTLASASSHREAPGITEQPKIDATDFYMFKSYEAGRGDYVTLIANYQPLQAPYGGPNYFTMDPDAIYEIHVSNDADAEEEITFQFKFDNNLTGGTGIQLDIGGETVGIPLRAAGQITASNPTAALGETESYGVTMITGDRRSGDRAELTHSGGATFTKPLDNVGNKTLPDYEAYADAYIYDNVEIPGCGTGRVFAGQREEAFAVNLGEIFDLVNLVPVQGPDNPMWPQYNDPDFNANGIVQDRANDDLIGKANVTTLALEVPIDCLTQGDEAVIGAWTTASLPQGELEDPSPTYEQTSLFGGAWVQQSRLSNPLVNEVVIGLADKDLFNAAEPTIDEALAVYVTNPTLPALLDILFRDALGASGDIAPSNFPRNDLVTAFLSGFPGVNQPANFDASTDLSEMLRLNTTFPATPRDDQHTFGLLAEDLGGFPNGRRPGDDTVDLALRVMMGRLCHNVPLGQEVSGDPSAEDSINLGLCGDGDPDDTAPAGEVPFTDGAPLRATELRASFPYLNTPIAGSPNN
ncbi:MULTISPECIES: DUF4331 domain-containing protein [Sulfitobacter]|jgi:uncharacterized protein DUF4331|uniref:DUF4331 domain-containing protein n=1 Tax=Sulfitobacter profundi TaxID=2679961 RepID=A0ABW1YZ76_9RHOB|nr:MULTISPECIES: DUF4331 domain-containing protein [Sulfitobacter]AYE86762.1 hypothetical protein B5M07_11935 [Sulfitobacter sp. D7]UWR36620.1 DUF4331 domain-containing protein [Sulfitobacter sp. W074]